MEIIKIKINEIKPYENNVKLHPKEQIEQIISSIKEMGFNDPIAVDENNVIIEGHGRYEALKQIGYKECECIVLRHLTEEQKNAYRLIHNKLTMNTDFDFDGLIEELNKITNIDMGKYDFNFEIEEEKEIVEDEVPEVDEENEPITQRGDIWKLGNHRLMCGDSTDKWDVKQLINGDQMDLLVTDPPYNVNVKNSKGMQIENDNMENNEFAEFLNKAFENANELLKQGGSFYVWHADTEGLNFRIACKKNGLTVKSCLIWVKNNAILSRADYHWKHEPCLYGWKEGASHYFTNDFTQTTVIEDKIDVNKLNKEELKKLVKNLLSDNKPTTIIHEDKPLVNDLHPTMKPIKLIALLVRNSSKPQEKVIDLFGGAGSTLIACEQLNRKCYTMEYDPKYCDVIIKRWEQFTGKKAYKING